ncbi:TPA: hypothetical protein O4I61_004502 [Vibrio parahaemolyticus]|nr:hypothetical protein [Vibrio parahaemolyticus]
MKILATTYFKRGNTYIDGIELNNFINAPSSFKLAAKSDWEPICWTFELESVTSSEKYNEHLGEWSLIEFEFCDYTTSVTLLRNMEEQEEVYVNIISCEKVKSLNLINKLDSYSSLSGIATIPRKKLEREVIPVKNKEYFKSVLCLDVGQANWNLVCDTTACDSKSPRVMYSFDFGLPTGSHWNTLPSPKLDPYPHLPKDMWVILSHWDVDHWAAAAFNQPLFNRRGTKVNWHQDALNFKWLVPNQGKHSTGQKVSPNAWRLALALYRKGNLFVWPRNLDYLHLNDGSTLIKSVSAKKSGRNNNNGLALIVKDNSTLFWPSLIMCPGDADYPSLSVNLSKAKLNNKSYEGLIASHHGGNITGQPPSPSGVFSKVAYSNGRKYKHPFLSNKQHRKAGWLIEGDTHVRRTRVRHTHKESLGTVVLGGGLLPIFAFIGTCLNCNHKSSICPVQ